MSNDRSAPRIQAGGTQGGVTTGGQGRDFPLYPLPRAQPRVVGPGRREQAYLRRQTELERALAERERALELAALLERGTSRWAGRLEQEQAREHAELERARAERNRMLVLVGALQRDNERLLERVRALEAPFVPAAIRRKPSLLRRLLGRAH